MEYRDFFGDRHRETFMKAISFIMGWFLFGVITWVQAENLIPSTVNKAPDYYCTLAAQNYMEGWGVTNFDCSTIEGGIGTDGTNEIDIEYARWGNAAWPDGNYTVYPNSGATVGETTFNFTLAGTYTTSSFVWTSASIAFTSQEGFKAV